MFGEVPQRCIKFNSLKIKLPVHKVKLSVIIFTHYYQFHLYTFSVERYGFGRHHLTSTTRSELVTYSGETSETDSTTKSKHFDSDKNEASELNTNEDESSGSLNIIVKGLKTELTELKSQFDTYRTNTNQTLKTLQDKQVRGLCDEKQNENNKLREENYKLKQENNDLNQRINNLENKLADLNGKIRTSDEEKASLIAAIRLLQSDIGNGQVETSNERTAWLESGSKRRQLESIDTILNHRAIG